MQDFRSKLASSGTDLGVELGVQVLTTGSWPTQASSKCILPRELEECCQVRGAGWLVGRGCVVLQRGP